MLEVRDFTKYYGDLCAVENLSFDIDEGEFVTLLGPSGCGKSTTLHAIAGLVEPTDGQILLRGEDVTDLPPEKRNIGMAFQSTALFPHMTVRENIAFGLKMHGHDSTAVEERVEESLELVDMPDHGEHKPGELSGGQQQRVSLARALAYEPDILLLDEPLTGLDRVLREEMRGWLNRIQKEVGVTTLYVTHDQEDALSMSDTVIVLNDGHSEQIDSPERIYESPASPFVAEFVGKSTRFSGPVSREGDRAVVNNHNKAITVEGTGVEDGDDATLYVRPEDIEVSRTAEGTENEITGRVVNVANLGNRAEVTVELTDGNEALAHTNRFPDIDVGDDVHLRFDPERVIAL
ncbi:ABC transporter ATP-binding protein [Natronomonas gomsonensis]|jgi:ABC-type Fe3+/spermidine/putrescine transport system ATPase subunit|uniref:ABC transporter ATP-binding protein n=1 Tax=Natronomonas gomsonensis TaxID=1046043 RepID=UPI0020CA2E68|nr:ABC transporter ATP-binding protein [Natronomonas gomsonensis]MCY4731794.1 ABC transporter ATP-binding protein [Natronomonas gomsonensis]